MAATTLEKISLTEYVEAERKSDVKHEYLDGIVIPMSGASLAHTTITNNISALIWFFIREKNDLTVHSSDLKVFNPKAKTYFYPDVVVIEGEAELTDEYKDTITNPRLIIEVLSDSTEGYDRGDKFQAYRSIDSLQEYVLVSQDKPLIEVFTRHENIWHLNEAKGLESQIRLQTLNYNLPLADVYAKVRFSQL